MNIIGGIITLIYYVLGLLGSWALANSWGWTFTIAIVLWSSFFGFTMVVFSMLLWTREYWLD